MSNPRQYNRAKPSEKTLKRISAARAEGEKIETMPDGKEKIAARKALLVKYADILNDHHRYERYLTGIYDYPSHADAKRPERGSYYGK